MGKRDQVVAGSEGTQVEAPREHRPIEGMAKGRTVPLSSLKQVGNDTNHA